MNFDCSHGLIPRLELGNRDETSPPTHIIFQCYRAVLCTMSAVNAVAWCIAMFCFLLILAMNLVQPSLGEVLNDGEVFQVYPNLEDVQNGTTPLYFALMQSFSGGYVSAGGIPGLMVALDEINKNSTVLPGYRYTPCTTHSATMRWVLLIS